MANVPSTCCRESRIGSDQQDASPACAASALYGAQYGWAAGYDALARGRRRSADSSWADGQAMDGIVVEAGRLGAAPLSRRLPWPSSSRMLVRVLGRWPQCRW